MLQNPSSAPLTDLHPSEPAKAGSMLTSLPDPIPFRRKYIHCRRSTSDDRVRSEFGSGTAGQASSGTQHPANSTCKSLHAVIEGVHDEEVVVTVEGQAVGGVELSRV